MDCSTPQDFTGRQFHPHHYQHHPVPHHLPHHHHHHFYVSPHCPLHNYMLHFNNQHSPTCPLSASSHPPSDNPEATLSSLPPLITLNLQVSAPKESGFTPTSPTPQLDGVQNFAKGVVHKENDVHKQLYEEEAEEEEEDPVFVLTDEWREFFAKSEAKRKLAKKQARQKGKNRKEQ